MSRESSVLYIENLYTEDVFDWMTNHVGFSGGDGGTALVCSNYREVSEWYIEWWKKEVLPLWKQQGYKVDEHPNKRDEYGNIINFHTDNENIIFTDDINMRLWPGEYIFIVKKDCISMRDPKVQDWTLKPAIGERNVA